MTPRFSLGLTVATPAALFALQEAKQSPTDLIRRHAVGDWGEVCKDDWTANERALKDGSRIFSSYSLSATGVKLWVITEGEDDEGVRQSTCVLLPDDY